MEWMGSHQTCKVKTHETEDNQENKSKHPERWKKISKAHWFTKERLLDEKDLSQSHFTKYYYVYKPPGHQK